MQIAGNKLGYHEERVHIKIARQKANDTCVSLRPKPNADPGTSPASLILFFFSFAKQVRLHGDGEGVFKHPTPWRWNG